MSNSPFSKLRFRPSLSVSLLCLLLASLWLAGGGSRADVLGQAFVRSIATLCLIISIILGSDFSFRDKRPLIYLIGAALLLVLLQLVPLPPSVWQTLPGRSVFTQVAALTGQSQPWRPLSIVPGATLNAAGSLIIPVTTLVLLAGIKDAERPWVLSLILGLIVAAAFVGLLQISGPGFRNPFVNDDAGIASGTFANRNHFALFLALGCLLAPAWAFRDERPAHWRALVALGLELLFILMILATGSRAGLALGVLALVIGVVLTYRRVGRMLSRYPRWVSSTFAAVALGAIVVFVWLTIFLNRAESVNRALTDDVSHDLRGRALPVVLNMIRDYFPFGTGVGGFDQVFRMHEPFELLKPTYFNHAHNDLLEIVLDAGLPGLLLLICALSWWLYASIRVWWPRPGTDRTMAKLGSAMLLLTLAASTVDYPARTPLIMAVMVVAGVWLSEERKVIRSALPMGDQHL